MTPRPSSAEYLREYKILVTFDDDEVGVVDLQRELWGEVFEPLRDVGRFRRFRFDPEIDTVVWPTGADLSPEYLHEHAVAGEFHLTVEASLDRPFFPVSRVRVRASDTGHTFRRHWAVVSEDRKEIFGKQSLKLKVSHATDVDLERRLVEAFAHRRFDVAGCRDKLEKLTRLSVPQERFPAGMLEILDVKPPAELPRNAARRDGWLRLGRCLRGLGEKYRKDLGGNAYALVNAASEYAGDTKAPLMSPARVDALQFRCGRWVDRVLERYGPALASRPVVDFRPGSMNAAGRLAAWAAGPRQSDSCSRS